MQANALMMESCSTAMQAMCTELDSTFSYYQCHDVLITPRIMCHYGYWPGSLFTMAYLVVGHLC